MKKILIFLTVTILGTFSYFYFFKNKEENFKVSVINPVRGTLTSKVMANGKIKYDELSAVKNIILLKNLISEKNILVKEGDKVTKGQELIKAYDILLANAQEEYTQLMVDISLKKLERDYINFEKELIQKDLEIDRRNSQKELESFEIERDNINLQISKIENEIFDLENILSSVTLSEKYGLETKNKIKYTKMKLENLEKEKILKLKEEKISEQKYITLKTQLDRINFKEAERNKYINNKIIVIEENLKLLYLKKEIKEKEINIKKAPYISPINGVVVSMTKSRSKMLEEDVIYIEIADMSTMFVSLEIPDYKMAGIEIGKDVNILYKSREEVFLEGKISRISPIARKDDRESDSTIEVEASLKNFDFSLRPGYEVESTIIVSEKKNIIKVPIYVVMEEEDKNFVYLIDNQNKVIKKFVKIGLKSNTELEIEGISENDKVITTNMYKLSEGLEVQVKELK